ncbi:MAG: molecular chaperone DnaJ [Acidobacteria bacterium]|nr:MAG: molecular chaperone DnaJ [Acidobacteriota bacterium]PYQ17834.1 MAG: molecular chaperone DnaJ [Acidobacteriota bacterium]
MDLYAVLGVRRVATTAEIRRAYQKLARQLHPDLNPGDPQAVERFQAVSSAFEVLSDPQRRAAYDRGESVAVTSGIPEVGFHGFDFSAEVRLGGAGFQEIFGDILRRPAPPETEAARGEDLEQTARLAFEECFHDTRRRVHVVRQDRCPTCQGAGEVTLAPQPCPACQGRGEVRSLRGRMVFTRRCSDCGGTGTLGRRPCPRCAGEGRVMRTEWLEVGIPAGVGDGSRVRISGAGNAGRRGGPPGDFVLVVEVEPHPFYRREGEDLHCELPVTIVEAALGAHVEVPTPEGPVTIEIPAGTQNGQRFRLRKRGLPRLGQKGRGDLYVEARVWVPPVVDDASRELLREFARRNPAGPRRELAAEPAARKKA